MARLECSVLIRAPPEPVFGLATDYEAFAELMPRRFVEVKIRSRRGPVAVVEERVRMGGRTLHMLTRHEASGMTHSASVLGGPARGSVFVEKYSAAEGGTLMGLEASVRLRGLWALAAPLAGGRIRREIECAAREFAEAAEARLCRP